MALPMLLGGVVKGLAGNTAKGAISGGKKAKDAKRFVSGKSSIIKQQKENIVKKTDVIPQRQTKFISLPSSVYKVPETKPDKDVSPDTLKKQLDNIDKTTQSLILIGKTENENLESLAQSAEEESDKRKRERLENKLEQGKKKTSRGVSFISPKGEFDPLGFLTNILLGGAALGLLNLLNGIIPQLNNASADGDKNLGLLKNFLVTTSLLIKPIKNVLKSIASRIGIIGRTLKNSFRNIVRGIKSTFSAIGRGINKLVKQALGIRTPSPTGLGAVGTGVPTGTNPFRTPRGRTPSTFALEQARRNTPRPQGTVRPGSIAARTRQLGASLQTGTAFGGKAAGLQRGLYKAPGRISNFARGGVNAARATMAATKGFLKRIPILGSLLVGIFTYIETGRIDQALFRAGGAAIGGALGSFIPFLGTIIGTFAGEYIGDLFFIGLRGGGIDAVGKKLKQDFMAALEGGKIAFDWIGGMLSKAKDAAVNWISGVFTRFYDALPKFEIPEKIGFVPFPFGLGGTEIINPIAFANPLTLPKALLKAFTNPESNEKGLVEKPEIEDQTPEPTKIMSETEFYNATVEDYNLPDTYEEYLMGTQPKPEIIKTSPRDNVSGIEKRTSYTPGPGQSGVIPVPVPGQSTPQISGGGGAAIGGIGPSTKDVVNSYYKSQLLGFLYKQG